MSRSPDVLAELGGDAQLVQRNQAFEPRRQPAFGPDHFELWNRIGPSSTIRDLIERSGNGWDRAARALVELYRWGALVLSPEDSDGIAIHDQSELGALTAQEAGWLAEDVDLEPWERRRIVAAVRTMRRGNAFEMLGISSSATQRELKRAYYQLSKEFHPDRYYGKRLGSFGPLLTRLFESLTQAVKTLSDPRTVTRPGMTSTGPRRRRVERFPFAVRVRVQCDSWPDLHDLLTQDVGQGGMFIPTDSPATLGDRINLSIAMPGSGELSLRGTVVSRLTIDEADPAGKLPGIGVRLDPLSEGDRERFSRVLAAARAAAPAPDNMPHLGQPAEPPPGRLARGTGRHDVPSALIGIDLGTTYTSISAAVGSKVSVLPWPDGKYAIPSVVCFPRRGEYIVGERARERLLREPNHTIASVKRLLGRQARDREVEAHLAQAPFETSVAPDGTVVVDMWGEPYAIVQICSYLLAAARDAAERALARRVDRAIVTVPVSFDSSRINLMRRAGRLANIDIVEVIDEPSAAALANRTRPEFGGLVGVYDFGGGTFDFSVVDVSGGDFRVLTTTGDSWLGGDDFDMAVAETVADRFWKVQGVDLRQRAVEWQHLLFGCEQAKRRLSSDLAASIVVPEAFRTAGGPQDLTIRVSRSAVEKLWKPVIDRSIATCTQALGLLGLRPNELSAIYLSGGTSYIPAVRRSLAERFRIPVRTGVPPEHAVCLGAGIQAAHIERRLTVAADAA